MTLVRERYPDCTNCEAPCCRRQFMEDESGWYRVGDARPIYLEAGTDIKVVGWALHPDGRQPMFECQAYDVEGHRCTVYDRRPDHCRAYDCREDDPDDWSARAHCDLTRHRATEARRPRRRTVAT